jgi:hypothetical protein
LAEGQEPAGAGGYRDNRGMNGHGDDRLTKESAPENWHFAGPHAAGID